jgi:flagellar motor switch protein FliN/FliY
MFQPKLDSSVNTSLKHNQDSFNAQPIELGDMAASIGVGPNLVEDLNPLHQVKTTVQVCVGTVSLSIGELMALKAHQVVRMQQAIEEPVDLLVEGKPVARGQLVAVDGNFAIRITELPVALQI